MSADQWCWFCGAKADLLCDGHLAWLKREDASRKWPVIDMRHVEKAQFRCDRPLCRACVKESVPLWYKTSKGCVRDSWDYCADCVKEHRQSFSDLNTYRDTLVTLEEGIALQKRRQFQTVKPINDLDRALARVRELEQLLAEKGSAA